jgi:hypothetical protein
MSAVRDIIIIAASLRQLLRFVESGILPSPATGPRAFRIADIGISLNPMARHMVVSGAHIFGIALDLDLSTTFRSILAWDHKPIDTRFSTLTCNLYAPHCVKI